MHDSTHQSTHAKHGEIALRYVDTKQVVSVPESAEDEAANTSQEQTRREDTATTTASVGRRRSKNLEDNYEEKVDELVVATIEKRPIHRSIPVALPVSIKEKSNQIVTFAIKRREEIDEKAQHNGSKHELLVATLQLSEDAFEHVHRPRKVECDQSANDSQSQIGRDAIDRESVLQMKLKDRIGA